MNINLKHALIAGIAMAGVGFGAVAVATDTYQAQQRQFNAMDKNSDNLVSRDELDPELVLFQEFDRFDVDGTNAIELDEFYQYVKETAED